MFDIIQSAEMLFGTVASSYKEIIPEFNCEYRIEKNNLPSVDGLVAFLGQNPERDRISITITSDTGSVFVSDETVWMDNYTSFRDGLFDGDEVVAAIRIMKGIYCHGRAPFVGTLPCEAIHFCKPIGLIVSAACHQSLK